LSTRRFIIIDLFLLTTLWLAAIIVVNPLGDFPLNDDWSYAIAVQRMLETGDFRPLGWTSSALITQTIWGTTFCTIFGYSFEVLRGATLAVSLLGVFTIYLLSLQLKLNFYRYYIIVFYSFFAKWKMDRLVLGDYFLVGSDIVSAVWFVFADGILCCFFICKFKNIYT